MVDSERITSLGLLGSSIAIALFCLVGSWMDIWRRSVVVIVGKKRLEELDRNTSRNLASWFMHISTVGEIFIKSEIGKEKKKKEIKL
ncbi:hypothetical protein Csa_017687 [Cucumis sativus]|uniref:Uncharacterized protein n=1 Tax=Cucumis sativus TaxID=3659 RepID=A0A0A0K2U2_CUCSA|nr:hypothetical protein Csa_017687 [Cucumis sativus]